LYLFLFTIGLFPGILWLIYFLSRDRLNPEPPGLIMFTFVLGMIAFWVSSLLEHAGFGLMASVGLSDTPSPIWNLLSTNLLIIGPVEELCKWLPVLLFAYFRPQFDEPLDGIIYGLASALGFAAVENIKYLESIGAQIILIRGALTNLGHAFFAGISCYGLGRAKFATRHRVALALGFLALASLAHGLYDIIVDLIDNDGLRILILSGFIVLLGIINYRGFRRLEKLSPFRDRAPIKPEQGT
jgi:protease PrsW